MNEEKYSLSLVVLCLIGSMWVDKQSAIGYISTTIFLIAAFILLIAYFKAIKSE